jgi:hypothetical protein
MTTMPTLQNTVPAGCRCPHCRYDFWMDATLRHNAEIARSHATSRGDRQGLTLVDKWFAAHPTPPSTQEP